MFFFLSKLVDLAFAPLSWALALILYAATRRRGREAQARAAGLTAVAVLVVFSLEPVANGLAGYAESGAVRTMRDGAPYDAVLVMGGMLDDRVTADHGSPAYDRPVERLLETYDLLRTGRARLAILSGGGPGSPNPEAAVLAKQLIAWGIEPSRVIVEPNARNTRENAVFMEGLVRARGLTRLLAVTSAAHMPRTMGCLRAVGIEADALPVDYGSFDARKHPATWLPRAQYLFQSTAVLRELVGRVVYRVQGYAK